MRKWRRRCVLLSVIAVLSFPAAVLAGGTTPNDDQYPTNVNSSGPGGEVKGVHEAIGKGPVQSSGSLPLTGFQAAVVLVAGGGLLGAGLVIRRLGRSDGPPQA
jgi:hypothetical protein